MFYSYVLKSKSKLRPFLYTGACEDLKKRFKEHNNGEVTSTRIYAPFELVYYEACLNRIDAFRREKYLKSGPGKRFLKGRLKIWLKEQNKVIF